RPVVESRAQRRRGRGRRHRCRRAAVPAHRAADCRCVIDTHAHLDALDDDPAKVVARAREAGVTRILTVGTDVAGCRRALELADSNEGVFAVLGIHPHEAARASDDDVAAVRSLLAHPKAVGAGETGLDWFRDYAPRDAQQRLFAAVLAVAEETGKPA